MTEERLIETLEECVDYLAKKYDFGKADRSITTDYFRQYITSYSPYRREGIIIVDQLDCNSSIVFLFALSVEYRFRIEISPDKKEITSMVDNAFEEYYYVYGKIRRAMK